MRQVYAAGEPAILPDRPVPAHPARAGAVGCRRAGIGAEVAQREPGVERSGGLGGAAERVHRQLTGGPPTRGRRALVWGLVALAMVVAIASSLTVWVERQVLDTDNWVDASSQLLADDEVRALVANQLVDALFSEQDVQRAIAGRLPPRLEGLAAPAAGLVRQAAVPAAETLLERPRVQQLWESANRVTHNELVAILRGNEDGAVTTTTGGDVVLDLGPLVERLGQELGLRVALEQTTGEIVIAESEQLSEAQDAVAVIDTLSVLALIAVIALLVVAVYLAAGFRREVLRGIGAGLVGVGVLLLVVLRLVGDALIEEFTDAITRPAGIRVWAIGTELLRDIAMAFVAYGIVLVLGALLAGPTRPARWIRRLLAPAMRDRPVIIYSAVGLIFLLVLLWGPTEGTRSTLGVLVLAALTALGAWALRRQTLREFPPARA